MNDGPDGRAAPASGPQWWRPFWAVVWKDLTIELRTGQRVAAMAGFAVLAGILFHYALQPSGTRPQDLASTLIWITILFSGTLGIGRTFELEEENGALSGVLLAPVARDALYLAKVVSNLVLVLVTLAVLVFVFALFFSLDLGDSPLAFAASLVRGVGGVRGDRDVVRRGDRPRSSMGGTLLPVLLFPVLVPVIVFGATSTSRLLAGLAAVRGCGSSQAPITRCLRHRVACDWGVPVPLSPWTTDESGT